MDLVKRLLHMLVLPLLLIGAFSYGYTGLYTLAAVLIVLIFLASIFASFATSALLATLEDDKKEELRHKMEAKSVPYYIGTIIGVGTVLALFVEGKYVIGTLYLLSVLILLGVRQSVLTVTR